MHEINHDISYFLKNQVNFIWGNTKGSTKYISKLLFVNLNSQVYFHGET